MMMDNLALGLGALMAVAYCLFCFYPAELKRLELVLPGAAAIGLLAYAAFHVAASFDGSAGYLLAGIATFYIFVFAVFMTAITEASLVSKRR